MELTAYSMLQLVPKAGMEEVYPAHPIAYYRRKFVIRPGIAEEDLRHE
jgi:hypothetical protein